MIQRHLISATMAASLVALMIHLWSMFAPVVVFMKASDWRTDGGYVSAHITGYKWLNCEVVKGSFVGWERTSAGWTERLFLFVNDDTPGSTRPAEVGRQSFGRWQWAVSNAGNPVRMTMQHDCGGEIRITAIGPFHYTP